MSQNIKFTFLTRDLGSSPRMLYCLCFYSPTFLLRMLCCLCFFSPSSLPRMLCCLCFYSPTRMLCCLCFYSPTSLPRMLYLPPVFLGGVETQVTLARPMTNKDLLWYVEVFGLRSMPIDWLLLRLKSPIRTAMPEGAH